MYLVASVNFIIFSHSKSFILVFPACLGSVILIHMKCIYLKFIYDMRELVPVATQSKGVGPWPLACCDCGFESQWGHGCLSVVCVVCYQVVVSAMSWSLVQRSPTNCGMSLCVIKKPRRWGGYSLCWAAVPEKIINNNDMGEERIKIKLNKSCS
jgi:hypothetical protein